MSLPSALMTLRPFLHRVISGESQHPQPARQARSQRRRLSGHLSPGGFARQGQRGELAARSKSQVYRHAAYVLAEGWAVSILDGTWKPPPTRRLDS
jgi:hypothetical protein